MPRKLSTFKGNLLKMTTDGFLNLIWCSKGHPPGAIMVDVGPPKVSNALNTLHSSVLFRNTVSLWFILLLLWDGYYKQRLQNIKKHLVSPKNYKKFSIIMLHGFVVSPLSEKVCQRYRQGENKNLQTPNLRHLNNQFLIIKVGGVRRDTPQINA